MNGKEKSKNLQREETQHLLENNKLTNNNLTNSESFLLLSFHLFFWFITQKHKKAFDLEKKVHDFSENSSSCGEA